MHPEILKTITLADITHQDMRLVAETCGIDVALALYSNLTGVTISIPRNALREFQERFIRENKHQFRAKELAVMLNLSERFVEQLVSGSRKEQLPMFE